MKGRKPIPTELRLLRGNPGKRKLNLDEPKPDLAAPGCPRVLGPKGRREYRRVAKELLQLGLVSKLDRGLLSAYALAWQVFSDAADHLRTEGTTITVTTKDGGAEEIQSPHVIIADKMIKHVRALGSEFGMSASSRSRLTIPDRADPDDEFFSKPVRANR